MIVENYETKTRVSVENFIKSQRQALTSEIVRLGGKDRVVNWSTLKLILGDLMQEGKVRRVPIGKKVILYEWIGGAEDV
jgi:hypothetical protein